MGGMQGAQEQLAQQVSSRGLVRLRGASPPQGPSSQGLGGEGHLVFSWTQCRYQVRELQNPRW